ncbi:MAG: mechanosensitive ion channel family protein [Wenzhouxiangellaceae bacterium]|nr:mechanosensitive ion channel family protein [Wenzhouxiangellaceae bacterium]
MKSLFDQWLDALGVAQGEAIYVLAVIGLILIASTILHFALHRGLLRLVRRGGKNRKSWASALVGHKLFARIALIAQGFVVAALAAMFLDAESLLLQIIDTVTQLWIVLFSLLAFFSLLNAIEALWYRVGRTARLPLRGIFQSLKLVGSIVALILAIALLIGKSPLILFSGLGAMTAVLLLIFRDPILGLVAGVQLSANDMLAVGDWLEMPQYGADGDVIDINLTTTKVRNWDKTITTIPNHALVSDSFKNWRNIEIVGGRRIKRAIHVDASSVRFVGDEELERLRQARLLSDHIEQKREEIDRYNRDQGVDPDSIINARHLTNLGIFRAYLTAYLGAHSKINTELTYMVRQLEPGENGIPLELYAFARETSWVPYENIQSDIFDHVYAVIPEFGLRLHQAPSGFDVRQIGGREKTAAHNPE